MPAKPKAAAGAMAQAPDVPNAAAMIRSTAIFRELSNEQLAEIWSRAKLHNLLRGATLVRQNDPSGRRKLPAMPSPIGVLQRCLAIRQDPDLLPLGPLDLVLTV